MRQSRGTGRRDSPRRFQGQPRSPAGVGDVVWTQLRPLPGWYRTDRALHPLLALVSGETGRAGGRAEEALVAEPRREHGWVPRAVPAAAAPAAAAALRAAGSRRSRR